MRVALCFSGLVGGTKGKSGSGGPGDILDISYKHFDENIFQHNEVDIFVHSWSVEESKAIEDKFNPKSSIFEDQIWWDKNPHRNFRKNNHISKWYSMKKAIELKCEYEKENKFTYDFVMNSRFDIAWQTKIDFKKFDKQNFYVGNWNRRYYPNGKEIKNRLYYNQEVKDYKEKLVGYPHNEEGFIDQWFFSSSENMDKFATLFDNFKKYDELGSETHDHEGDISNHRLACHHIKQLNLINNVKFAFYLHDDFPLIRRWYYKCGK